MNFFTPAPQAVTDSDTPASAQARQHLECIAHHAAILSHLPAEELSRLWPKPDDLRRLHIESQDLVCYVESARESLTGTTDADGRSDTEALAEARVAVAPQSVPVPNRPKAKR